MKKICIALVILLVAGTALASAQPVPGKKLELGTACSFSSFKFSDSTESNTILSLALRFGYFVWKGLEIEPEVMMMKFEGSDAGYLLSANLSYNFKTSGALVPFVLGGAGFGNAIAIGPIVEGDSEVNATLFNLGAGLKYVVGGSAAVRLEYRYTHSRLSDTGIGGVVDNLNSHQLFIGLSLFF